MQNELFSDGPPAGRPPRPEKLGPASIEYVSANSILSPATGFMADYDYTLNPYSGCSFACDYCYAAAFARSEQLQRDWGRWVKVKEDALDKLRRVRRDLEGRWIYMSSVTDPYQPIESKLGLVRDLLEELVQRGARLVVQTRSPLVVRDADLLERLRQVQVNLTVTTDSEEVRRDFEPICPGNDRRLEAVRELSERGIATAVTMTPLLPVRDPVAFARELRDSGARHFVVQPLHPPSSGGRFRAATPSRAREFMQKYEWDSERHADAVRRMREVLPVLEEGKRGFAPPREVE